MDHNQAMESAGQVRFLEVEQIREHILCKARRLLNDIAPNKPVKYLLQLRKQQGLNDLTLKYLDRNELTESDVRKTVSRVFSGFDYDTMEKDVNALATAYMNMINLLIEGEYTLVGSIQPIEHTYDRMIVKSRIDCTVKSKKTGRIYPTLIDFSRTQYEVEYNPISYVAQTIADHLDLANVNTEILILSVGTGKQWIYNSKRYGSLIHSSILETVYEITHDLCAVRFGWWCPGCHWRGICHSLVDKHIKGTLK